MLTPLQRQVLACATALALYVVAGGSAAQAQNTPVKTSDDTAKTDIVAKAETSDPKRAKLIADTRRLLVLSREVQAEMTKSGPDTLSLGTVKKVEELQKLAAVVKTEMGRLP
jgi:hypothetical protein